MKPDRKITVLVSQSKPFAFYENGAFKGLDVNIVENFAKKFNLNVEYTVPHESLNKMFLAEDHFANATKAMRYS